MNTSILEKYAAPLARILIVLLFLVSGISIAADISNTAGFYASVGIPMAMVVAVLVLILKIGGSLMIAAGVHARPAAWGLIVFTILATLIAHTGEGQLIAALKNLSIVGGLLLIAFGAANTMTLEKYCPCPKCRAKYGTKSDDGMMNDSASAVVDDMPTM